MPISVNIDRNEYLDGFARILYKVVQPVTTRSLLLNPLSLQTMPVSTIYLTRHGVRPPPPLPLS